MNRRYRLTKNNGKTCEVVATSRQRAIKRMTGSTDPAGKLKRIECKGVDRG